MTYPPSWNEALADGGKSSPVHLIDIISPSRSRCQ
jgi:hypothetical protein